MTKNSATYNRTLFLEDNLPVLRGLDSKSIDLIATDPPFNKGVPAFEGTTKAGDDVEFKDVWNWDDDVHTDWTNAILKDHPSLYNVIHYANAAAGDDMGAFLCWMAVRVLEMKRVLKDTGSIYLHCDPTASHYLKAMMDAIFGRRQFVSEIIWNYGTPSGGRVAGKRPVKTYESLLVYAIDYGKHTYNIQYLPYSDKYISERFTHVDEDGRRYRTRKRGEVVTRQYLDESLGVPLSNVWTDLKALYARHLVRRKKEETGYPTQKPLDLYERIVKASSNPGDMVLDPFAGCATTCVAAEQLGRQWIGVDIQETAGPVILERLQKEVSESMAWNDIVRVLRNAPERTDDGEPVAPELVVTSRKKNAPRIPVREVREQLLVRDGQRCQGCGWVPPYADYLQVDHKRPKSRKGRDEMQNFALLCDPCNRKKSNKLTLAELRLARVDEDRMDAEWWEDKRWE